MTEEIDIDETMDGYRQAGPNGNQFEMPPASLIEAAMRQVEKQDVAGRALAATELSESAIGSEFISPELLRDNVGWMRLSTTRNNLDMTDQMRMHGVWRARQFARHDGISKQTVALYTNFGIGTGFAWDVMGDEDGSQAQDVLDELIALNPKTFGAQGQRTNSDGLYTDGEWFPVLFVGSDTVKIRQVDVLELTHIITDPDDRDTTWMYVRKFMRGTKEKTLVYRDWKWDGILSPGFEMPAGIDKHAEISEGVIYHVKLKGRGKRGDSGLLSDMDWSRQYRNFMTARAAITLAIASLAYKLKVKGNAGAIAAIKAQRGTALSTTPSSGETNPPQAAGSTWMENAGAELSPMKQETGALAAKVDAGLFIQMAGMGSGIYPQYYGTNSFRLATAVAMEPPMMKAFESYQALWADVYENIIRWVWTKMGVPEDEQSLNTTAAPIQETNKTGIIESVAKLVLTFPPLGDSEDLMKWALQTLGLNDADELIAALDVEEKVTRGTVKTQLASALREVIEQVKGKG